MKGSRPRSERAEIVSRASTLLARIETVLRWHAQVHADAQHALTALGDRAVTVVRDGTPAWAVIGLCPEDRPMLATLAARARLPELLDTDQARLVQLRLRATDLTDRVAPSLTWRRWFVIGQRRRRYQESTESLAELMATAERQEVWADLDRWGTPQSGPTDDEAEPQRVLDPRLGVRDALPRGAEATLIDHTCFGALPGALTEIAVVVEAERPLREAIEEAADRIRQPRVMTKLATMDVADLDQVSSERLRTDLLRAAGLSTVADVLAAPTSRLRAINGIGPKTVRAIGEASALARDIAETETEVTIDLDAPTAESTALVVALNDWGRLRHTRGAGEDLRVAAALAPLADALREPVSHAIVTPLSPVAGPIEDAIEVVLRRAELLADTEPAGPVEPPDDPWEDYRARSAEYHALLADAGVSGDTTATQHGELTPALVETVDAQHLRTDRLTVTLRTYQSFAARFALVQRRVIIGDEMGLGKTVEALAVLAHLWATGARSFLVICPAGVIVNWVREAQRHTDLPVWRLHGPDRDSAIRDWRETGGIGVTTYSTLGWHQREIDAAPELDCVVADEAHYVKNSETWRARATRAQLDRAPRALLLTGTPLENHVDDFLTLVSYLQPELLDELRPDGEALPPRLFRRAAAPVYLRRNLEDVLTELPERIDVDEWLPMSEADVTAYRSAVEEGNFAAMRRAAALSGQDSRKVQRLVEIVTEAEENDRRVVAFSYFRDVLAGLHEHLPGPVFGPLTGDVDPVSRQAIIDDFSGAQHGAVLLAQITTGGVGLNIQAASVVVLVEPQLKPTTEDQAIARTHRMGQLRTVQVHRLLSEDAVDERIVEALARKRQVFDDFVRESSVAAASPDARDFADSMSDAELGRHLVAEEQERLLYRPPTAVAPDD